MMLLNSWSSSSPSNGGYGNQKCVGIRNSRGHTFIYRSKVRENTYPSNKHFVNEYTQCPPVNCSIIGLVADDLREGEKGRGRERIREREKEREIGRFVMYYWGEPERASNLSLLQEIAVPM